MWNLEGPLLRKTINAILKKSKNKVFFHTQISEFPNKEINVYTVACWYRCAHRVTCSSFFLSVCPWMNWPSSAIDFGHGTRRVPCLHKLVTRKYPSYNAWKEKSGCKKLTQLFFISFFCDNPKGLSICPPFRSFLYTRGPNEKCLTSFSFRSLKALD